MYEYQATPAGADSGLGLIPIVLILGFYVFYAYCQSRIAHKLGQGATAWWAWIPFLNVYQLTQLAGRPGWWFVLCLVPFVNVIAALILWIDTAKNVGQSPAWGFLMLLPFLNFVALAVLAFSSTPSKFPPSQPSQPARPREPQGVA